MQTEFVSMTPLMTSKFGRILNARIAIPITCIDSQPKTRNISLQLARRKFLKKQILAARMNVPISGTANPTHTAHIHAQRNSSETTAYNSPAGPIKIYIALVSYLILNSMRYDTMSICSVYKQFSILSFFNSYGQIITIFDKIITIINEKNQISRLRLISQNLTTYPLLMCDVMNKKVSLAPTLPASTIANTKTYVKSFMHFLNVSNRLLSMAEPDDWGGGGSWNESQSI